MRKIFKIKFIKIHKEKLFWAAVLSVLFLVVSYFTILNATVFNTAKIVKAEKEINSLNQNISSLEFELINIKNNIDLKRAYSMGFEEADNIKFVRKKSVAAILNTGNIQ